MIPEEGAVLVAAREILAYALKPAESDDSSGAAALVALAAAFAKLDDLRYERKLDAAGTTRVSATLSRLIDEAQHAGRTGEYLDLICARDAVEVVALNGSDDADELDGVGGGRRRLSVVVREDGRVEVECNLTRASAIAVLRYVADEMWSDPEFPANERGGDDG